MKEELLEYKGSKKEVFKRELQAKKDYEHFKKWQQKNKTKWRNVKKSLKEQQ